MHMFCPIPGHISTLEWLSDIIHLRMHPHDRLPQAHLCSQWESAWLLPSPPAVRRLLHTRACSHCVRGTGPHPYLVEACLGGGKKEREEEEGKERKWEGGGERKNQRRGIREKEKNEKMRQRKERWRKVKKWKRREMQIEKQQGNVKLLGSTKSC